MVAADLSIGPIRYGRATPDEVGALLGSEVTEVALDDASIDGADPGIEWPACRTWPGTSWVVRNGGLAMLFEGATRAEAVLTNWQYVGGPVGAWSDVVAPGEIHVGMPVDGLVNDLGQPVPVDGETFGVGSALKLWTSGGRVTWFGAVECAFEDAPEDAGP